MSTETGTGTGKVGGGTAPTNVLFLTVDSLSRHFLEAYAAGDGDTELGVEFDVATPNIDRFAERAVAFDAHYAGSLPCMPARREWLTGTQEFLWRPWGPIEPFDTPLPRAARDAGVLSAMVTDHYHYFQHGSAGYYEDFVGYEFVRGHEYDAWKTSPAEPDDRLVRQSVTPDDLPERRDTGFMSRPQYARNVEEFDELDETEFFAPKVFGETADWLREAGTEWDRWLLFVDSFDVHEPFHCPEPYASMYTDEDPTDPELVNWPYYGRIDEGQSALTDRQLAFVRAQFAGKVTMVDRHLGRVFDALERENLYEETTVVLTADHGHYLGEHGWIGKPGAPLYDVLARTPLLVAHPGAEPGRADGLTAAVDLYATALDALGVDPDVPGVGAADYRHSRSLLPVVTGERSADAHRDWTLYGYWGSTVNVTDGRWTYMHPASGDTAACFSTTQMNPNRWFTPPEEKLDADPATLPYADAPVWRFPGAVSQRNEEPLLFDTERDPGQEDPVDDDAEHERMRGLLVEALDALAAPEELHGRLGLN